MRQVEIIKQINSYTNNNKFKRRNCNDDIYECSRHLKVIKYDRVRNSLRRLFHYFGTETVKAASTYIDKTSDTESFISSHLRLRRVVSRIMIHFDRYDGTPIYIAETCINLENSTTRESPLWNV